MKRLLDAKADVNATAEYGDYTPLFYANRYNAADVTAPLAAAGGNILQHASTGCTTQLKRRSFEPRPKCASWARLSIHVRTASDTHRCTLFLRRLGGLRL